MSHDPSKTILLCWFDAEEEIIITGSINWTAYYAETMIFLAFFD